MWCARRREICANTIVVVYFGKFSRDISNIFHTKTLFYYSRLLDEEAIYPNSNDDTFLERLFSHYGDREHHTLLRKCAGQRQFVLHHLQGTNPVLYAVDGWVRHSREHPGIRNAVSLLQDSSREEINRLYIGSLTRGSGAMVFCGSFAGLEGTQSLRRVSSIRRSFTTAGVKRNSIMLQVKFTVDGIIDTLRRTGTHFVHCYLLQHNAGRHAKFTASGSPNPTATGLPASEEDLVNVPLLRSQVSWHLSAIYSTYINSFLFGSYVAHKSWRQLVCIVWVSQNLCHCWSSCVDLVSWLAIWRTARILVWSKYWLSMNWTWPAIVSDLVRLVIKFKIKHYL